MELFRRQYDRFPVRCHHSGLWDELQMGFTIFLRQGNRWLLNMTDSGNKSSMKTLESIDMLFPKVMVAALLSLDDGGAIQKVVVSECERSYHFVSSGDHPILVNHFSML